MNAWRTARGRVQQPGAEEGQVTLLILVFTMVAVLLIMGTVAVTSAQLSRVRLLDAADGGQVRRVIEMSGEPVAWGVTIEPETGSETPTEPVLFVAET